MKLMVIFKNGKRGQQLRVYSCVYTIPEEVTEEKKFFELLHNENKRLGYDILQWNILETEGPCHEVGYDRVIDSSTGLTKSLTVNYMKEREEVCEDAVFTEEI